VKKTVNQYIYQNALLMTFSYKIKKVLIVISYVIDRK